jgi:hypothetical protein
MASPLQDLSNAILRVIGSSPACPGESLIALALASEFAASIYRDELTREARQDIAQRLQRSIDALLI